jgi:hypothetical protein
MDDMDMAARCVYAMWDLEKTDTRVRQLVGTKTAAELRAEGERIVANPYRTQTTMRVHKHAIAMRLEE